MKKIVIFASGSGTNAENIVKLFHGGNKIRVAAVLCNRGKAGVYDRMQALDVPCIHIPSKVWDNDPQGVLEAIRPFSPELIVLAGFMKALRPELVKAYSGKIINIHPSLLPAYGGKGMYGHHVHEAVMAAGEKKSGVTVHYVTEEIDGGEILMQQEVAIEPDDNAETLEAKIHPIEYSLYPKAIVEALKRQDNTAQPSPYEQWAQALHVSYSDSEAEARAAAKATPPPTPPAPPVPPKPEPAPPVPHYRHQPNIGNPASPRTPDNTQTMPKSWLWLSILVCLMCCTPLGIVAIIFSASVRSRFTQGDTEGAERASRRAQTWIIASFCVGLLWQTLYIPLLLAGLL